ncbi:hypothetical protein SSX86_005322 [Deinandra increscens subsp. villosa]|uniref:Ubiquitin-like domain-containing protein n=1 Tax=Deinandra increscens subsp. villosa TaxID=3103831 RepID=A0AAP0DQA1_9ASTR
MDLFFDAEKGISFTVEVGYFDTIQEIKEKVTKYHGIPVHEQTLKFDGKTLPDDLNIHTSDILDGSHLKLITATATEPQQSPQTTTKVKTEDTPSPSSCSSSHKMIKLHLKPFGITIELDTNDPVLKIKEKTNEAEGIPIGRMVVYANGIELHDHKSLHDCQLADGSEVELTVKPPTPPTPPPPMITHPPSLCGLNMGLLAKKMKVYVMSKCGEKISLEVNGSSNVGELRKELEKVRNQGVGFRIPEEGYFFIYKQNVMEEDHSFRWHRVGHGDTIEIFNGCVTGGS